MLEDQVDQREAVGNSNGACGVTLDTRVHDCAETLTLPAAPELRESGDAAGVVPLEDHVEPRETVAYVSAAEQVLCAISGATMETRVHDCAETLTLPAAPELLWFDEVNAIRACFET